MCLAKGRKNYQFLWWCDILLLNNYSISYWLANPWENLTQFTSKANLQQLRSHHFPPPACWGFMTCRCQRPRYLQPRSIHQYHQWLVPDHKGPRLFLGVNHVALGGVGALRFPWDLAKWNDISPPMREAPRYHTIVSRTRVVGTTSQNKNQVKLTKCTKCAIYDISPTWISLKYCKGVPFPFLNATFWGQIGRVRYNLTRLIFWFPFSLCHLSTVWKFFFFVLFWGRGGSLNLNQFKAWKTLYVHKIFPIYCKKHPMKYTPKVQDGNSKWWFPNGQYLFQANDNNPQPPEPLVKFEAGTAPSCHETIRWLTL